MNSFLLHPPVQPSSWAIEVSAEGSVVFVQTNENPVPELPPEHYIFHPKNVSSKSEFIFLKTPRIVNAENEVSENVQSNSSPRSKDNNGTNENDLTTMMEVSTDKSSDEEEDNEDEKMQEKHKSESSSGAKNEKPKQSNDEVDNDFVVFVDPENFSCSTSNTLEKKSQVTNLIKTKDVLGNSTSKNLKPCTREKPKEKPKVLTTMIELSNSISSDDEENNDDEEVQEMQRNQTRAHDSGKRLQISTTPKSNRTNQPLDDFMEGLENLSNIPLKKPKDRRHYQAKLEHPDCARPGREWKQQLMKNTAKKPIVISSNGSPPSVSNRNQKGKSVSMQHTKQQASCGMEFFIKKCPEKRESTPSNIQDEQRMDVTYQQEPAHAYNQFPDDNGNAQSRYTSAKKPGRAYIWEEDDPHSFQGQNQPNYSANNVNNFYNNSNSQLQGHQAFHPLNRNLNLPVSWPENGAHANGLTFSSQQPPLDPYHGLYGVHQSNFYQGNHFIASNQGSGPVPAVPPQCYNYSNTSHFYGEAHRNTPNFSQNNNSFANNRNTQRNSSQIQDEPTLDICSSTYNFYRNGEDLKCEVICDGWLTHNCRNLSNFGQDSVVSIVHLKTLYQDEPGDVFENPEWADVGFHIASLIERSKVDTKILQCPPHELTLAYLKPNSESQITFSVAKQCYTSMFNYLATKQRAGVFSYERSAEDKRRKQTAYLYPLSKKENPAGQFAMLLQHDVFPPPNRRPDLLLMIILTESAINKLTV